LFAFVTMMIRSPWLLSLFVIGVAATAAVQTRAAAQSATVRQLVDGEQLGSELCRARPWSQSAG
jgi:hypothetical protein